MIISSGFQFLRRYGIYRCLGTAALLLLACAEAMTQTSHATDGTTPLGLAPGSPSGSYALNGFDNINLYNGNMNVTLPMLHIGGRGGAQTTMSLGLNTKRWHTESYYDSYNAVNIYYPDPNWWPTITPGYGPGVMLARSFGVANHQCSTAQPPYSYWKMYANTLTRLSFIAPDGTEYELRDQNTGGQPLPWVTCATGTGAARGRVFTSADGASMTFVSDAIVYDINDPSQPIVFSVSGYLLMRDGTRYRVDGGLVSWIRDRNGNKLSFSYDANGRVTTVIDSLNRQVTVAYDIQDGTYGGLYDKITFKGYQGTQRIIHISKTSLSNALRNTQPGDITTAQTYNQLFGAIGGPGIYNPTVVNALYLPDNDGVTRKYQFVYNPYAEITRIILPTGGAVEYDMVPGSGVIGGDPTEIYRRVAERRTYPDGSTLENREVFNASYNVNTDPRPWYTTVMVDHLNSSGTLLAREKHYFNGSAAASLLSVLGTYYFYPDWNEGQEYQTEALDTNGATVLRRTNSTFQQRASVSWWSSWASSHSQDLSREPANDARVTQVDTTLVDTNQVSRQTFSYDPIVAYNNQTDVYEYDFGSGAPGALIRRNHTDYLTINSVNSVAYDVVNPNITSPDLSATVYLRGLPIQQQVFDAGGTERARTSFEYDNYTADTNHAGLVYRSSISGLDSGFTTSNPTRGNATATTNYFLNSSGTVTGSIAAYAQFDIAGNLVKMIDRRGYATNFYFADCFGAPDGEARTNTAPLELSSLSQTSYALVTSATNAFSQTAYSQYDFYTGHPVDGEDPNGIVASGFYNDALDRPTQVIRAANQLTSLRSQTSFAYDDVNRLVTTTSDLSNYTDNVLKSQALYDGLGRTTETRQYEGGTNYIAALTQYDAMGRAYKKSNPFRPWQNETAVWTTTAFDALGRVFSVTTPDSAMVTTAYGGNAATVTDQNGKARKSIVDAVGRLTSVYEDPSGLNYQTSYRYDVLDDLLTVTQGTQLPRSFIYDSLKRLTSATNPENGMVSYQYDNNGNLIQKTDARSVAVTTVITYDALNRVKSRSYNDGTPPNYTDRTPAVNYFYDNQGLPNGAPSFARGASIGRLVAVSYGSNSSAGDYYGFDVIGREVLKIQQTGGINYQTSAAYNVSSALTSETYPSLRTVSYNYDQAGRLGDKDANNLAFTGTLGDGTQRTYSAGIVYSSLGGMSKEQFGTTTPIYNKLFYNVRGQLSEIRESTSYTGPTDTNWNRGAIINNYSNNCSGMCSGQSMTDNNGNVKKQEHWIPDNDLMSTYSTFSAVFTYDSLNRLQAVNESKYVNGSPTGTPTYSQSYTIDQWGNRTISQATGGVNALSFNVDTATNRLTAPTGYTMSYDGAGNLINDTYTGQGQRNYDAENRMNQAWANGQWQIYTYDGNGKRVRRKVNGVETWQVYGLGGELIAEYPANANQSNPQREYGYRNGQLLITTDAGTASAPAPSALTANPPTSGASITLNWTAASGATNYRVERKAAGGAYASIGTTPSTILTDSGASSGSAYLYKVCAADVAGNCTSGYSNIELGARFNFPTDPTITSIVDDPTGITVTTMKASHITELRTAVNAVRALAGSPAATWTNPNVAPGVTISVADVRDLRTALGYALSALGIQTPTYTDPTIKGFTEDPLNATPIRAAHIRELRQYATRGIGGSGGGGTSFVIRWLVSDQLGTPRMIFDQTGSLANVSRHDYLPFGEELFAGTGGRLPTMGYTNNDGARQKFTGYEADAETGLNFAQARYQSSLQGRFTSVDPISGGPHKPQSWNTYAYSYNNPLRYTDPSGMAAYAPYASIGKGGEFYQGSFLRKELGVYGGAELGSWSLDTGIAESVTVTISEVTAKGDEEGGDAGKAEEPDPQNTDSQFASDSTMVIAWDPSGWRANPLSYEGHVSYITMQNDTSYSFQSPFRWTHDQPSSKYTNERSTHTAGIGYVLDFSHAGAEVNAKFQKALLSARRGDIYDPFDNNCANPFVVAINAIHKEIGTPKFTTKHMPIDVKNYIEKYLQPKGFVVGGWQFPKH